MEISGGFFFSNGHATIVSQKCNLFVLKFLYLQVFLFGRNCYMLRWLIKPISGENCHDCLCR